MAACVGINVLDDEMHGRAKRLAMLKKRFAGTISKATKQLQKSDTTTQQYSEKDDQKRSQRLEAEILIRKNLMLKRKRERAREAVKKLEKSVQICDDNAAILKGLEEMCSGSIAYDLFYGDFCRGGEKRVRRPLEKLGLYLKQDDHDYQDGLAIAVVDDDDLEEGEIRV